MDLKLCIISFVISFVVSIFMNIRYYYAYKRCNRFRRCRQWMCKYFHECEYAEKRDQE